MRFWKIAIALITTLILTVLTQIGGLVFLASLLTYRIIDKRVDRHWARAGVKVFSFLLLYLVSVFIIVPLMAKPLGRVQLPLFRERNLQPGTIWTFLLCRNYVRPPLRELAFEVADKMSAEFPGTVLNYLDANFPFIDKFPLLPHRSHNDGKKLDISFSYIDKVTGKLTGDLPSFIGYGICEAPMANEENMTELCDKRGYWQYSLLQRIVPQKNKHKFEFDGKRTKRLVNLFAEQQEIGMIFIEPHLKTRLGLTTNKIRFHGCQAVRHDDHMHVQLR